MRVEKSHLDILVAALDGSTAETTGLLADGDIALQLHNGHTIGFGVKWAGEGWPQDVRSAAADVAEPWPANVVLLARQLSPGAIEWLRARGANWADETGQARILGPGGLTVIREPAQRPSSEHTLPAFMWSKSAIAIAEAILAREDRPLRATELASATGWSVAQTANVLRAFDGQGWIVKHGTQRGRGAYRELVNAAGMLAAWSSAVVAQPRSARLAHRATQDVMRLLREDLAPALRRRTRWAVSGWAGLELAAPFATTTPSLHIYIARDDFAGRLSDAIEQAGLREVDEGGRVIFWLGEPSMLGLVWRMHNIPIVSPPRLYADLSSLGARGQDAADHVREQLVDPLHARRTTDVQSADG
jgi:Transcriptional regulator, AbiEi antitoxin, Type IV TA system